MHPSVIISGIGAFITWLYLTLAENAITTPLLGIIHDQANVASQYNLAYGLLINLLIAALVFVGMMGTYQTIAKGLRIE